MSKLGPVFLFIVAVVVLMAAFWGGMIALHDVQASQAHQSVMPKAHLTNMVFTMNEGDIATVPSAIVEVDVLGRVWIRANYEIRPVFYYSGTMPIDNVRIKRTENGVQLLESSIGSFKWRRQQLHDLEGRLPVAIVGSFE